MGPDVTSLMPGPSSIVLWTVLAPTATIGRVLPTLLTARTTFSSLAPLSVQPATAPVTSASPYAASLLPK